MTKPSDYLAVLIAKREEQHQPKPSEAVVAACDLFLSQRKPPLWNSFVEKSIPNGDK